MRETLAGIRIQYFSVRFLLFTWGLVRFVQQQTGDGTAVFNGALALATEFLLGKDHTKGRLHEMV